MTGRRVATLLVLAAIAGAIGWWARTGSGGGETDALRAELSAARAGRERAERDLAAARNRMADAERALEDARALADRGRDETETRLPQGDAEVVVPPVDWPAHTPSTPTLERALGAVDWDDVGRNMARLLPHLAAASDAIRRGEQPPSEAVGAIQQHTGALVAVAVKLQREGVGGTGVGGPLTHPAFAANLIAVSLREFGTPLGADQVAALDRLARTFEARVAPRVAGQVLPDLRRALAEVDVKREFFAAAFDLLTDTQQSTLRPPGVRGRVSVDLFCEGLVWDGRLEQIVCRDAAHLAEQVETSLLRDATRGVRDRARPLIREWAETLSPEIRQRKRDGLDRSGMPRVDHVARCAGVTADLIDTLLRNVDLDDASRATLVQRTHVIVPHAPDGP